MPRYKMTVEKLLMQDIDIDVCDDVEDEFCVAFVGPQGLTEAGRERFGPVLGLDVSLRLDDELDRLDLATVHIDGDDWKKKLARVKALFRAAAGYCPADDYNRWFMW